MPGAALGRVVAPSVPRDADAVRLEGMMPIGSGWGGKSMADAPKPPQHR